MNQKILIVDDDEEIRTQMKWALAADYEILVAGDREEAIEQYKAEDPLLVLLDLGLPPCPNEPDEGLATLAQLLEIDNAAKVIIISGQGDKANAVRAVGMGACDFFGKPVQMDELRMLLQRCLYVADLEQDYRDSQAEARADLFEGILGGSPQMHEVFATIKKVSKSLAPVLVLGESGTGKEMVAKAIHRQSDLRSESFVAINCSAIPENLLESELFGHEKGAFTGAHTQRMGLIESAAGGTLFLDEIGDLPPPVQVKLLRFLQEKKLQRVGGREELEIDARVVAATNVDLQDAIREGRFREDLYFRLAVVISTLPPLRERGNDVVLLANDFLRRFAEQNRKKGLVLSPQARNAICRYPWPGNVRELQNRIQRAVIMADGRRISVEDLELQEVAGESSVMTLKEAREKLEREMAELALKKHSGNITAAASELGVSRPTFYELMDKLGIPRKRPRRD